MKSTSEFYSALSMSLSWLNTVNDEFREQAENQLKEIEKMLPNGSGFDIGCKILRLKSKPERIVIQADFHHMDEHGYYDGWTEHQVIITPSLQWGYNIRVTGRNRNEIKDYIHYMFNNITK